MKVRNYYPELYKDNLEMQSIGKTEEKEFEENLKPAVDNAFNDTFITTATETGVEKYEKIFSIVPDEATEDLQFRKERVLNRLMSQIPFTKQYLENKLDYIIGKNTNGDYYPENPNNNQWYYTLNYGNYQLNIYIAVPGRSWLNELTDTLSKVIPCNLAYTINIYAASWQQVYEHFPMWQDLYDANLTWQEVMDAEWLDS